MIESICDELASRTLETTDGSVLQPAGTSNNEADSKDMEEMSMKFHKATLSAVPDINVKYSAYKATEFVVLRKSAGLLDEYIGMIVADGNLTIPKADVNWNPPVLEINLEHQRLFQHVYDSFINEKVEFLVRAVPDADPDFLEERVNSFQGLISLQVSHLVYGWIKRFFIFMCRGSGKNQGSSN